MLVYYIDKFIQEETELTSNGLIVNITVISNLKNEVNNDIEEKKRELFKKILSFCGVEVEFIKMLQATNMKYKIKEYGIYFGSLGDESKTEQNYIVPYKIK